MSGTSLDGLDICLVEINSTIQLIDSTYLDFPSELRQELLQLCSPTHNELERLSLAEQQWARLAAQGVKQLLQQQNLTAADITGIGSHGQTIRHHPELGFSVQIGAPALLAELTNISVVSHFRQRDIAAGGQGAPLVPAFHEWVFKPDARSKAIVNIGGFSNITFLNANLPTTGFDCGPGNALLDAWIQQHQQQLYDNNGAWAASGVLSDRLLQQLLLADFFHQQGPKSTGRELFNLPWLSQQLSSFPELSTADVQCTLVELTATAISQAVQQHSQAVQELWVCGGGAHNGYLLKRLSVHLPNTKVGVTDEQGVPADWMEAMAFAWLAYCCLTKQPANLPEVTGAQGPRILGAIYPA